MAAPWEVKMRLALRHTHETLEEEIKPRQAVMTRPGSQLLVAGHLAVGKTLHGKCWILQKQQVARIEECSIRLK